MLTIYLRAKVEAHYNATVFFNMINTRGGLSTAKYLINTEQPSQGYTTLHLKKRLDLTVEAMVVEDKRWHSLFSEEELEKARKGLEKHQYTPKG